MVTIRVQTYIIFHHAWVAGILMHFPYVSKCGRSSVNTIIASRTGSIMIASKRSGCRSNAHFRGFPSTLGSFRYERYRSDSCSRTNNVNVWIFENRLLKYTENGTLHLPLPAPGSYRYENYRSGSCRKSDMSTGRPAWSNLWVMHRCSGHPWYFCSAF